MTSQTLDVAGVSVPAFMYGTAWKEEATARLTRLALDQGFAAIDTANQRKHYFEQAVGEAVAGFLSDTGKRREDLFLQTKFTHQAGQDHRLPYDPAADLTTQVTQSFASSLEHLQTDYLDSYVLHGPSARRGLPDGDWEVWHAMEQLHHDGKTRLLGVSNVNLGQLEELVENASVKPAFVQNRCYARTGWDREVRAFCRDHAIVYQGFSLLTANVREIQASLEMRRLRQRTHASYAQLVFAFAIGVGMLPLTGTSDPQHMAEDLAAFDIELSEEDLQTIQNIAT